MLSEAEKSQLLVGWNDTRKEIPPLCVQELFEEQVRRTPEATAVVFKDKEITYGELNREADRLARRLRGLGVEPESRVGLCVERSPEMLVGMLGILKAGGAYVPLDPAYPRERLEFMVRDAGVEVLLTQTRCMDLLPKQGVEIFCLDGLPESGDREGDREFECGANPDSLAYVMYTSGSTGTPKGVEILHQGIVRLLFGVDYARFGRDEVFLQMAPISFDASTLEIWGALMYGARLVLFPAEIPTADELGNLINKHRISTLWLTSSLFNAVIDEAPEILSPVAQVLTGGEALSVTHVRRAVEMLPNTRLINCYGPTECTTFASWLSCIGNRRSECTFHFNRPADWEHGGIYSGPEPSAGADRDSGRVAHWRNRSGERVSEPAGTHRRKVYPAPVQPGAGCTALQDRGPGEVPAGWKHRVSGADGRPGEDPRIPD